MNKKKEPVCGICLRDKEVLYFCPCCSCGKCPQCQREIKKDRLNND